MTKISALVLAYNNEKEIERSLKSLYWVDEIVIIDSFSQDQTVEIAKKYTDKIYQHTFSTFGELRSLALTHASYDWIFSLDTDEEMTKKSIEEIKNIMKDPLAKEAYFVPRKNFIFGRWLKYGGWYPDYRQPQLFKKEALIYHNDDVHEGFTINGRRGYLNNYIHQYPFRDLSHYLSKMERYSSLMAKRMQKENKKFSYHKVVTHPLFSFVKMYIFRKGFLDGFQGFLLAVLYTYYTFVKYVKFWELKVLHKRS